MRKTALRIETTLRTLAALLAAGTLAASARADAGTNTAPGATSTEPAAAATLGAEAAEAGGSANVLRLDLGWASALGFGGVSYTRVFSPNLQLEAGVGAGLSGTQLSLMLKATTSGKTHKLVFGLGPSLGLAEYGNTFEGPVAFVNAEVGYQYLHRSGFTFHLGAGMTMAMNGGARTLGNGYDRIAFVPLPQARIGFGYAF